MDFPTYGLHLQIVNGTNGLCELNEIMDRKNAGYA
jgi:hypothetical protein